MYPVDFALFRSRVAACATCALVASAIPLAPAGAQDALGSVTADVGALGGAVQADADVTLGGSDGSLADVDADVSIGGGSGSGGSLADADADVSVGGSSGSGSGGSGSDGSGSGGALADVGADVSVGGGGSSGGGSGGSGGGSLADVGADVSVGGDSMVSAGTCVGSCNPVSGGGDGGSGSGGSGSGGGTGGTGGGSGGNGSGSGGSGNGSGGSATDDDGGQAVATRGDPDFAPAQDFGYLLGRAVLSSDLRPLGVIEGVQQSDRGIALSIRLLEELGAAPRSATVILDRVPQGDSVKLRMSYNAFVARL